MKTITFNSTKGGAGKSDLSIITLNAFVGAGCKCLAIDTDMINYSLSFYFNSRIPFETIYTKNIFHVFTGSSVKENVLPKKIFTGINEIKQESELKAYIGSAGGTSRGDKG